MARLTYRDSGVDTEASDRFIGRVAAAAERTRTPHSIGRVGGFAALCTLPSGLKQPVLVSGSDGVGTKLLVAHMANRHDTIGVDLVAMCVNDVLTTGARPLFFLDYLATGKLDVDRAAQVIEGVALGCAQAGCALVGGETAEMPGMYANGDYDLAGFAVGVLEREHLLQADRVREGDVVLGLASSGLHSNGYSLARKALLEVAGHKLDDRIEALGEPLVDTLLRPTRIYARACERLVHTGGVRVFAHVTGGGLPGNLPRVLPQGLQVKLHSARWPLPAVFQLIAEAGQVSEDEMFRTFNMGIGFVAVVAPERVGELVAAAEDSGERAYELGQVERLPCSAAKPAALIVTDR
ncbi:MAG: phosphoribosylformylglycinamidine cyclo-ligase [Proteobacteria bacterium]|nr:phosphoribosylformylglycinamidine cyclo-ligase [Pseudomonadota bacterium]